MIPDTSDHPRVSVVITPDDRHAIATHARTLQRLVRRATVDRQDVAACVFQLAVVLQQADDRAARRPR